MTARRIEKDLPGARPSALVAQHGSLIDGFPIRFRFALNP